MARRAFARWVVTFVALICFAVGATGLASVSSSAPHLQVMGSKSTTVSGVWLTGDQENILEVEFNALKLMRGIELDGKSRGATLSLQASLDRLNWRQVRTADALGRYFRLVFVESEKAELRFEVLTFHVDDVTAPDLVNVFMGTSNQGPQYSHGNQYPGIHTPFGMAAWSVGTGDLQNSWFYDFKDANITGIKLTHQPTVWGGDFGAFDIMPISGTLTSGYGERASPYEKRNETAHPYAYRNTLDRYGITFEFAPSDRGGIFDFDYPAGKPAYLVFGGAHVAADFLRLADSRSLEGRITNGDVTTYFRATFNHSIRSVSISGSLGAIEFLGVNIGRVTMRLATSYISPEQASANLDLELASISLEQLKAQTKDKWQKFLGAVEVAGGRDVDQVTFYSALYRAFAFPKMHWEPIGRDPATAQYFSPFDQRLHLNRKLWTGNGFWDTYRGVWPLFTILFPELTGEMLEGWVNAYRDGGWTVRWSKPGYWECMIGTHTDMIFADAFVKGIRNWDFMTGYEASLKNGLVAGGFGGKGRRFLERSAFLGYAPWTGAQPDDEVGARTFEDSINDFGISRFAAALGRDTEARYFQNRAHGYGQLWSPEVRFFRGLTDKGAWRTTAGSFNPFDWRYEWTEGNAWHYRAAALHDGAGLAALMGGREGLEKNLDETLAAPPRYGTGGYGFVIHEMLEAETAGKLGFGQFAVGNQPVHHMLHMYAHAGRPSKTQYWVRRALRDLFESGYTNGLGYPGDEDNGQMSAWFVMNAMGFYSATPGTGQYILASPLFDDITLHLENGNDFRVAALGNGENERYVADAELNGHPYELSYLKYADIMSGGVLSLHMSDQPTHWAEGTQSAPASLSQIGEMPHYENSFTVGAAISGSGENLPREGLKSLIDRDSRTKWLTFSRRGSFTIDLGTPRTVDTYTMTSAEDAPGRDPRSWRLLGSTDGVTWAQLDERHGQWWGDRLATRIFECSASQPFRYYRLSVDENNGAAELQLAEFELRKLN